MKTYSVVLRSRDEEAVHFINVYGGGDDVFRGFQLQ